MLRVSGGPYWTMLYGYLFHYSSVLLSVLILCSFFLSLFSPFGPVIIRSHISVTPPPTTQHSRNLSRTLELSVEFTRTGYTPTWHAPPFQNRIVSRWPFPTFCFQPFMCDTIDYSLIYDTYYLIASHISYPYHISPPTLSPLIPHTYFIIITSAACSPPHPMFFPFFLVG